jgi:flagellar motor protein MotB
VKPHISGFSLYKPPPTTHFAQDIPHMLIHINISLLLVFLHLKFQIPKEKTRSTTKQTPKEVPLSKVNKTLSYYIVFKNGEQNLSNEMKEKLNRIVKIFNTNPNDTLTIMSEQKKILLHKERSISVNNYLISKGVPASQIRFVEYGKLKVTKEIQLILKE